MIDALELDVWDEAPLPWEPLEDEPAVVVLRVGFDAVQVAA